MDVETKNTARSVRWYEVGAFILLVMLTWADEHLFGGPHQPNIGEACLESIIILAVAIPIVIRTRRLVARPFYLDAFLKVCAWCQKVEHVGQWWVPIGDFFEQQRF